MKSFIAGALLAASTAAAAPTACDAPSTFKLAAQPLSDVTRKTWLQAFDNSGITAYQILFGSTTTEDYATAFSFDAASGRLADLHQSRSGTTLYSSLSPTENQLLNLTTTQSDPSGGLAVSCDPSGVQYLVDSDQSGTHPTDPWLLCQIPGFTTGLTQIYYDPVLDSTNVDNHEGGVYPCTRVGLSIN